MMQVKLKTIGLILMFFFGIAAVAFRANRMCSYKVKTATLRAAACGKANGSITINTFETETPVLFEWLDATGKVISTERNLMGTLPGTYRLFGDDGLGCKNLAGTFTIEATTDLIIHTERIFISTTDCFSNEGNISNVSVSGGTAPLTYQWFDANNRQVGSQSDLLKMPSATYYLKVTDAKGCQVQSDGFIIPPSPLHVKLADSFSPNGDGINDVWKITGLEGLSNFEIKIFNRQGNLVFHTKNKVKDFDGKYHNVDLPVGVYYYLININNVCKGINGTITLIR